VKDIRPPKRGPGHLCWTASLALLLPLLPIPFLAFGQKAAADSRSGYVSGANQALINPDDVLDLYVMDVPELSRSYRVGPDGTIAIALLEKPLLAAGSTAAALAEAVGRELQERGLVSHPHVTVSIAASRLKSVAITGAVRMPQLYPVFGTTTLWDLLSQAQGLREDAGGLAVISRGEASLQAVPSEPHTVTVDLRKLLESGDRTYNPVLYPGDRVTVPRAGVVYVVGAVNKPGGYPIRSAAEGMTVLQAIALSENTKSTAVAAKAMILRPEAGAPEGHKELPINLKRILAAQSADLKLEAGDILFVPDSTSAKALRRGIEAALQTVSLLAAYGRL